MSESSLLIKNGMDEEAIALLKEDASHKYTSETAHLNRPDNSKPLNCITPKISLQQFDILSSSLIESPVVYELLVSHGLLSNGVLDNTEISESEDEEQVSPSSILNIIEDEDEKGDFRCCWQSCDISFTCRKDLAQHVNSSHVNQDENSLYRCHWRDCIRQGKAINARYRMLIHIRTHTHEKPHGCEICGKNFSRLENLRIHIRSHTGEKPYACPVAGCGKAYSNSSDRFRHSKTHQEDKPYVCRVEGCLKRYTDPSSLRKHMKSSVHAGANAIKSNSLSARFKINGDDHFDSNREVSSTTTKGSKLLERPYACKTEGCNKRYTDPSSLRKHQRVTLHGRDPSTIRKRISFSKSMHLKNSFKLSGGRDRNGELRSHWDFSKLDSDSTKENLLKIYDFEKTEISSSTEDMPFDLSFGFAKSMFKSEAVSLDS